MPIVRIPPALRATVGGREVEVDGATVGEVLTALADRYPDVKTQLFDADGLRKFVNVYLNQQDITYLDKLSTPTTPTDTVIILPALAGGTAGGACRPRVITRA
jgi:molybdopterin synthase sulfur carrier subunit